MLLRYPGGKSRGPLKTAIVNHILENFTGGWFCEPFFGGGAISFELLKRHALTHLSIAESDTSLMALWKDVIFEPKKLKQQVRRVRPSVDMFLKRKRSVLIGTGTGIDALIVNRLAHGGRGVRAGPQGGMEQTGKYKIGCRWNAETLCETIDTLSELLNSVTLHLVDDYRKVKDGYMYVDPPYYEVGDGLYLHHFDDEDHAMLAEWLSKKPAWLLSYNNHDFVRRLYSKYDILVTGTSGNGGEKPGTEVLIWR